MRAVYNKILSDDPSDSALTELAPLYYNAALLWIGGDPFRATARAYLKLAEKGAQKRNDQRLLLFIADAKRRAGTD